MNLKELTWENHKRAERKRFTKTLLSGKISPSLYYKYLTNQYYNYVPLEVALKAKGFPPNLWHVFRAEKIREDLQELEREYDFMFHPVNLTPSYASYAAHIETLDYQDLLAHMYVRHFGDMYGGAIIQKRVPGSGKMYDFENKEELKQALREMLTDEMADEANICFEYAIRLFDELDNGTSIMGPNDEK